MTTTEQRSTPAGPVQSPRPLWQRSLTWAAVMVLAGLMFANILLVRSQLQQIKENSRERAFWVLCHPGSSAVQRTELFLKLVADGNTEWRSARLDHLVLPAAHLAGAQLESAVFSYCDFRDADFTGATLNKAGLDNSQLDRARFTNAQIRNATFFKSVLPESDFRNADLISASLEQARVHNATFVTARMGDAFLSMTDLTGSDLTGADLSGANLEAAILKNTNLSLANLYGANLTDTDLTDSNWWRARGLSSAQLDELTALFPPSKNAPKSRQRDFQIWLDRRLKNDASESETKPDGS